MARVADSRRKRPQTWTLVLKTTEPHPRDGPSTESLIHDLGMHQSSGSQWSEEVPRALHPYSIFPVDTDSRARQLIHFSMYLHGLPVTASRLTFSSACRGRLPLPTVPERVVDDGRCRLHRVLPLVSKCCAVL
jgi:hypothetical protein